MKKAFAALFLTLFLAATYAQKTVNDPNVEQRYASGFHAIEVSDGIDLYLSSGSESIAVSASEIKYRDRIKTEVKDGVLKISYTEPLNFSQNAIKKELRAYVAYTTIDRLKVTSGSRVTVDGTIQSPKLSFDLRSGAVFTGKVNVTELTSEQSSGSRASVSGNASSLNLKTSSGSHFSGYQLTTESCTAKATSGGGIDVTVTKQLDAHATSGGHITYKGDADVKKLKSGGGGIRKV